MTRYEQAREDRSRGLGATLRAIDRLRELRPDCDCGRATACHVVNMHGPEDPRALCDSCYQKHQERQRSDQLDRQIQQQREEVAAMRARSG